VAAVRGVGRRAWPTQCPCLAAQVLGVRSPRGRALSQVLGACRLQPHHASTKQCNLQ